MGVRETKGKSRGDLGKIHRSKGFGVQGCRRKYRKGDEEGRCWCGERGTRVRARGEDETRTVMCGGVRGSPVESDEGRSEEQWE